MERLAPGLVACYRCGKVWFHNDIGVERVTGADPGRSMRCQAVWECEQRRAQCGVPPLKVAPVDTYEACAICGRLAGTKPYAADGSLYCGPEGDQRAHRFQEA